MRTRIICFILCLGYAVGIIEAQTAIPMGSPSQATLPQSPTLSVTEKTAVEALVAKQHMLQDENRMLMERWRSVEADVAKAHPGYHLSNATGDLEKDLPSPTLDVPKKEGK